MNLRNSVEWDLKSLWTMVQRGKILLGVVYKDMIYSIDKGVSSNSVSFQPCKRHSLSTLLIRTSRKDEGELPEILYT